jgi:membrane protease subunit (stomatin/prohibitin family)
MKDQLEKLKCDLEQCHRELVTDGDVYTDYEETAKGLIEKGWRKQSEGEWIERDDDWCGTFYTCSACGCDWTTIDGTPQENNMRFCPECGAHMKGGAE